MNGWKGKILTNRKNHDWFIYGVILLGIIVLSIRACFGVDTMDEAFYFSVAKRFVEGDMLFRQEWFPTQVIGTLIAPFYWLYVTITGSQEGIYFFARICFVFFSAGITLYLYRILRERALIPVFFVVVCFLFYVRANIATLSYYSLGMGCFSIYLLTKYDFMNKGKSFWVSMISGISFAINVICMPYMVIYFAGCVFNRIFGKLNQREKIFFKGFVLGIAVSASIFLLVWCRDGNWMDMLQNMKYIFMDPEHEEGMFSSLWTLVVFMVTVFYKYTLVLMIGGFVLIALYKLHVLKSERALLWIKIYLYMAFFIQSIYTRTFFEGGIIISFFVLAMQMAILKDFKERELWNAFVVPGIIFGLVWVMGSNVSQRVLNMGFVIADIWAVFVIWDEFEDCSKLLKCFAAMSGILFLGIVCIVRIFDIYHDAPLDRLDTKISTGAWKGIYTTEKRAEEYETFLEEMKEIDMEGKNMAVFKHNPWIYVEVPALCGSYSTCNVDYTDIRNEYFYEMYPERIPDVICLLNEDFGAYECWRYSSHGSSGGLGAIKINGYLQALVETGEYEEVAQTYAAFYVKSRGN